MLLLRQINPHCFFVFMNSIVFTRLDDRFFIVHFDLSLGVGNYGVGVVMLIFKRTKIMNKSLLLLSRMTNKLNLY